MIFKMFSLLLFGCFAAFAVTLFLDNGIIGALIPALAGCAIMALYSS